jgi:HupE / UreJ protein
MRVPLTIILFWWAACTQAFAHSQSYGYLNLDVTGERISGRLEVAIRDLNALRQLDTDGDGNITWGELRVQEMELASKTLDSIAITADGHRCALTSVPAAIDHHGGETYAVFPFATPCGGASGKLELTYGLLFDVNAQHRGLVTVNASGATKSFVIAPGAERVALMQFGGGGSFLSYAALGFTHIIPKGLDHILFVIGLFLLSPRLRPLTLQITSFTIAHTVSLALAFYGVVKISPAIVEPLIAASIVFVAVENLFTGQLQRWRPLVVFGFGLLHGLGFAGVLAEIGLSRGQFAFALVGFNIGVELGQLTVIAACFAVTGYWIRYPKLYRKYIAKPSSAAIACIACYWVIERTL